MKCRGRGLFVTLCLTFQMFVATCLYLLGFALCHFNQFMDECS